MALSENNKTLDASQKKPRDLLMENFEVCVPVDLYADKKIPEGCVRLFCIIRQLRDEKTLRCTETDETLAYYMGKDEKTVRWYLKELQDAGFLVIGFDVRGEGQNRQEFRYLFVSEYKIDILRETVRILDDKENTKRVEAFENDENADCEDLDEDTAEELFFKAQKA